MTEWLNPIVGEEYANYASIGIALIIVFLLISFLFRILNAFRAGGFNGKRQNRLGITQAIALEGKRRIVLVRRDDVEHLIMIGGENDLVIEKNIEGKVPKPLPNKKEVTEKKQAVITNNDEQTLVKKKPLNNKTDNVPVTISEPALERKRKTVSNPQTPNDSAKITKEMDLLLDQIAGD